MKDPEDREAFMVAIEAMCAVYQVEATLPLLSGYWLGLQDMSLEEVQGAVAKTLRQGDEFMPKPGELRSLARPKVLPYHQPWKGFPWDKDRQRIDESWEPRRRQLAAMKKGES